MKNAIWLICYTLNIILLHAQDTRNKNITKSRSASIDCTTTSKKSRYFTDPELQLRQKECNNIELETWIEWTLQGGGITTPNDENAQFGLNRFLVTKYNVLAVLIGEEDNIPIFSAEKRKLGANYQYCLGLYHRKRALKYYKEYTGQSPRTQSGDQHSLLQKAKNHCEQAKYLIEDTNTISAPMNKPIKTELILNEIDSLLSYLIATLEITTEYRQGINAAKSGRKQQETGKNKLSLSQKKSPQSIECFELLIAAKNSFLRACEYYLEAAGKILDKNTLRGVEENLDRAQDAERMILEFNSNTYKTEPRIPIIAKTLEDLKAKLKQKKSGISSVEDSLEFHIDQEKRQ